MLDSYTIAIIIFVLILLLFAGIKIWYAYNKSSFIDTKDDELVQKLKKCGWKLISKKNCIYCHKQLELINYPHIDISDVHSDVVNSIKGVPLWINPVMGIEAIGLQSKKQLLELANKC